MRLVTLLVFLLLTPGLSWANMEQFFAEINKMAPAERQKKLVAGARQEGELMLYSSSGLEEVRALTKHFAGKYPFINARFMRKGGSQLFNVAQLEFKGQKRIVDVYWAGHSTLGPMLKGQKEMLARYFSPERSGIPDDYKDKEGYWTATRTSVAIFGYHSQRVPKDKVPKVFTNLLDPFWKGKLAVDTNPGRFTAIVVERMGWDKAKEFHQKLGQQDLKIHRGRTARMQLILAGEVLGSLDINADNIVEMQLQSAPLEYAMMDPTLLSLTSVALPSQSPHPHTATLFYDFIISKEGQELLAKEKNVPVREDVELVDNTLAQRMKEARGQRKFVIDSPDTYDPAGEEKYDRLYIDTLVKKR
ncbi:MAG TPA: ABC transporter substrate-binding protein [Candidatus Binatia bacterium]